MKLKKRKEVIIDLICPVPLKQVPIDIVISLVDYFETLGFTYITWMLTDEVLDEND